MVDHGDSDRFEPVEPEPDEEPETPSEKPSGIGYFNPPVEDDPNPEPPGEPDVTQEAETKTEMVTLKNMMKQDLNILIINESGVQEQIRMDRLSTFGPIERSRLTPQIDHLQTNGRLRIIES